MINREKVKEICNTITERIKNEQIGCFSNYDKPLFLISTQYPGIWLEHVYDSVFWAKMSPEYLDIAVNTINLFIDNQLDNGQLPYNLLDEKRVNVKSKDELIGYTHTQEVVSFARLALEVCQMKNDRAFYEKCYKAAMAWDSWLRKYRMTSGRGLVEMFYGWDTGHDNSGRLNGMKYRENLVIDGEAMNASVMPTDDELLPILAVDMSANLYSTDMAIAEFADYLGDKENAAHYRGLAKEIKQKMFELLYDETDAFFYDVDRSGNKRKFLSCTIFYLFYERVLDKEEDAEIIEKIYKKHIKNPDEFWTACPLPSMAVNDPSCEGHDNYNCWGYYSQALIALRCTRWMDHYGFSSDFDYICEKWIEAWTDAYDDIKLAQELDPLTCKPTRSSEWYSSCMLFYLYASGRLGII